MSDSANLLNISQCTADVTSLGSVITIDEVQGALKRSKNGKSLGDDGIPTVPSWKVYPYSSMVSHQGHNCIFSALTILDSALTS